MERELELSKLRRLRRCANYPLGLFLAAIGRLHWVEEQTGGVSWGERGSMTQAAAKVVNWRPEARGCPYCGRNEIGGRGRRAGAR